ncbi:hypothetical protein [Caproicibacter sp.]|uniref:hypothetical protein n=1 Tax=Caproicibacter sp. TaxID=2814884 RepID=UPI003988CAC8
MAFNGAQPPPVAEEGCRGFAAQALPLAFFESTHDETQKPGQPYLLVLAVPAF